MSTVNHRDLFGDSGESTDLPTSPNLKLFAPEPGGRAQDITSCARAADAIPPVNSPPADLADLFARVRTEHRERRPDISPQRRDEIRNQLSLWDFWAEYVRPLREQQVAAGKLKRATFCKDREKLQKYREWDLQQAPAEWPAGVAWTGLPCGYLTGPYFERFLTDEIRRGLRPGSIGSTWSHLAGAVKALVTYRILDEAPKADVAVALAAVPSDDEDDEGITTYTTDELERIYLALPRVDLQVAWILGASIGPRTIDLFQLRWQDVRLDQTIPAIYYRAHKTGKRHACPLPAVALHALERLRRQQLFCDGLLFPDLTTVGSRDPERCRPARRRNDWIKQALLVAGFAASEVDEKGTYGRPIQVLRKTAISRLNNHRPGVRAGRLMCHGADYDVNSRHYDDYLPRLAEAVQTLPQPEAFERRAF